MTPNTRSTKTIVSKTTQAKRIFSVKKRKQFIKANFVLLKDQIAPAHPDHQDTTTLQAERDQLAKENEELKKRLAKAESEQRYSERKIKSLCEELNEMETDLEGQRRIRKELEEFHSRMYDKAVEDFVQKLAFVKAENERKQEEALIAEKNNTNWFRNKVVELKVQLHKLQNGQVIISPPTTTPIMMPHCQICLCKYSDNPDRVPRVLQCGHSLCTFCAERISSTSSLLCPFDRCETCFKGIGVSSLPKNFTILEMMDADYNC